MKCPQCGTANEAGFRFCVKCGVNLENPQDINIEQVDMGGYHSEEDSANGGFTLGSGTFTISDKPSRDSSSDLYTAAELNDSDEVFDFSSIDEPFIPHLDTGRVTLPEQTKAVRQAQMQNAGFRSQSGMAGIPPQGMMQGLPPQGGTMAGIPAPQGAMQGLPPQGGAMAGIPAPQGAMQGLPPQGGAMAGIPAPQGSMQGIPPQGGAQMNGMPMYGQPMMYSQPQLIGYDQSGNPLYGQPVMYSQPQLIGYDQNGNPVYGQPVMYAQPQIIGYDQNGMPVYGQPMMYAQPHMEQPEPEPVAPPVEDKEKVEVPDDFWEFFDGGKATEHASMDSADDFFGKRGDEIEGMKRFEKKNQAYMSDTPLVDARDLKKNESDKYNKYFMRSAGSANPNELKAKQESLHLNYMGGTKNVDANQLRAKEEGKAWNLMGGTKKANASDLEMNTVSRSESLMAQADRAVEAMPKKAKTYNDEIDAIELPEEMKAKKTNLAEIPGLPEIK
ncbi:hypothetical protein [Ruminococcus sp.]|uniref:DUF7577 domain-containing protein n=1 Tax=Ruminococcus sp. TaxID=41978 RepID=UPI0025F6AEAA|nr:hypothetical protein [Ruminococcus sp.]MCR4639404.1 hypothetical protein [Ruminococcus sp.]